MGIEHRDNKTAEAAVRELRQHGWSALNPSAELCECAESMVVEDHFGVDLPGKPTDTVNLWILSHTERIPTVDEHFLFDGLEVKVQAATSSRIEQVLLAQLTPADDAGA